MKIKFSFFADPKENKTKEYLPTLAHLPASRHTNPTLESSQKSQSANPRNFLLMKSYK
jgi:hypothetical protein